MLLLHIPLGMTQMDQPDVMVSSYTPSLDHSSHKDHYTLLSALIRLPVRNACVQNIATASATWIADTKIYLIAATSF